MEIRMRRTPPATFGPALRQARERAGLGLREAARLAGTSHGYLIGLEAGTRCPSVTMAGRLADALGLDDAERAVLLAGAVDDAGLDHPEKHRKAVA